MLPTRLFSRIGWVCLAAALTTACGGGGPPLATLTPVGADSNRTLTLRPGDVIKVQVFGHEELTGDFPVDENDSLLLPIVGGFSVKDMTVADLRARIKREFGQLYTQSFVNVTPLFRVSVVGEVVRPGLYSVDATLNIYEVLANAGGTTRYARENAMRLIRNGQQLRLPVDAASLARATLREIGVRSGDQIVVPRRGWTYESWLLVLQATSIAIQVYVATRVAR